MKRVQLALSPRQVEKLKQLAEEWGLSFAETVRRVIDASPVMLRVTDKPPVPPKPMRSKKGK